MSPVTSIPNELFFCRLEDASITDPYDGIKRFFDGGGIDTVRKEMESLRDVLLSESYGELEPNDKYMTIYFFRRLEILVESSYVILKAKQN